MKKLSKQLMDKEIDIELFNQTLRSVADLDVPESKPITDFGFLEGLIQTIDHKNETGMGVVQRGSLRRFIVE